MRSFLLATLTAIVGLFAPAAMADEKPLVVLELFTSQGCSNCPPADAMLAELAMREDVLPLGLHVDYWDYIGWADSYARTENTARQKAYARVAGHASIYTPQIVIGGVDHVVGFKPMKVAELLQAHAARGEDAMVDAELVDGTLSIRCEARRGAGMARRMTVDLVGFEPSGTVEIRRGENAGETITYANIVTFWERLGTWSGRGAFDITTSVPDAPALAIIVQEEGPGRVIAARRVR